MPYRTKAALRGYRKKCHERANRFIRDLKNVPCADCGVRYPSEVMDFDHVSGIKKCNVSEMRKYSVISIAIEADKCDVVCANCHRIRTFHEGHDGTHLLLESDPQLDLFTPDLRLVK